MISKTAVEIFLNTLRSANISEKSLDIIGQKMALQHVKANTVLVSPGQVCTHVYFVLEGGFVCRYINERLDTAKTINCYLNDLHPFMACIDSFFTQTPTSCELRAIADSMILAMPKKDIDPLTETDENLRNFYNTLIITALTEENDLKLKIIAYPSEDLYQYILEELPAVIQKVPSKYIAELMGISAEWLSKIKRHRSIS